MTKLQNGDPFPALTIGAVGGGSISLPDDLAGSFGVVLIYRGSWCPFCNLQLAGFAQAAAALAELDVKVVALSVDDEAAAASSVEQNTLGFPVGHGADVDKVAERLART